MSLETDRLYLRKLTCGHAGPLASILNDAQVRRWMHMERETTADAEALNIAAHQVSHPEDGPYGFRAAMLKHTGEMVGRCGLLRQVVGGEPEIEVAYLIARMHWGMGLATEAALALKAYATSRLGHDRLVSLILPENRASIRVAIKNGMTRERRVRWRGMRIDLYAWNR